jgi:hypothetical protein
MPANTETKVLSLALPHILSFAKLGMPVFQRHFGWGVGEKEQAGFEYFQQFLINTDASDYFGQVSLFSDRRWRYGEDKDVIVWVADAQHRLVLLVLTAWTIMQYLRKLESVSDAHAFRRPKILKLMQESELHLLATSPLEVALSFEKPSEPLIAYVQGELARAEKMKEQIVETEARYSAKREAIRANRDNPLRRETLAANTQEKNRELNRLRVEIAEIGKNGIIKTYSLINEFLGKLDAGDILTVASDFVTRVRTLQTSLNCLEPRQGYHIPYEMMEVYAYQHFANITIQSGPMSPGEMLGSAIRVQRDGRVGLAGYFGTTPCVEKDALKFFGITNQDELCDYLTRMDTGDDSTNALSWIKRKLHSGAPTAEIFDAITTWTDTLVFMYEKVQALPEPWKSLYTVFFRDLGRSAFAVNVTRFALKAGREHCDDSFMQSLLRMLVLFVIAAVHRTPTGAKFRITRDASGFKTADWDEGLALMKNHFAADSLESFRSAVINCVSTEPLGLSMHRKLAKFLLVLADVTNGGRAVQIPAWASYDFEHIFPVKHTTMLAEPTLTGSPAEESVEEILALPEFERTQLINLLGNGALLGKAENISLSNNSPYHKYQAQADTAKYSNAWWPSHLKSLQDTKGVFSIEVIQDRSRALAKRAVDFLLAQAGSTVEAPAPVAPPVAASPALQLGAQMPKVQAQFAMDELTNVVRVAPQHRAA